MALGLQRFFSVGLATTAMVLVMPLAFGGQVGVSVIDVNSGLDLSSESNSVTGTDVLISDVGPTWKPNGTTADGAIYSWISYADTGINCETGGTCPGNGSTTGMATAIFTKTFDLPDAYNTGTIYIWADDTASVFLDGKQVYLANSVLGPNCANGAIGCIPSADGEIVLGTGVGDFDLTAGSHTLTIDAFQLGGGPFGVLYEGELTSGVVPEPGTYALLGFGLVGLMFASKRLKRRA